MTDNPRFAEYATSGAFAVSLSRNQIASLALVAGVGGGPYSHGVSLERRGLVTTVKASNGVDLEFRLTPAGALVLELCRIAGLTNIGVEVPGAEIEGLHRDLDWAREHAADQAKRARSMHSRLEETEYELADARREIARLKLEVEGGVRLKASALEQAKAYRPLRITLRDPLPELSTEQVMAGVDLT